MSEIQLTPCPKCEGRRIIVDTDVRMSFVQPKKDSGFLGTGMKNVSRIQATVCLNCGYAELYNAGSRKPRPAERAGELRRFWPLVEGNCEQRVDTSKR